MLVSVTKAVSMYGFWFEKNQKSKRGSLKAANIKHLSMSISRTILFPALLQGVLRISMSTELALFEIKCFMYNSSVRVDPGLSSPAPAWACALRRN